MITLNAGQQAAVDGIVSGVLENNAPGFTLIGEGGTGKTTSIMHVVDRFVTAGLKVLLCAPTNKAVKQLEKSARSHGLKGEHTAFMTLHRALGLTMLPSEENKFAVQVGKGSFELFDVIIIDEASMLSKIVLNKHVLPRREAAGDQISLILMGDDMQLPPVKETKSLAFEVFPTFRLTEVERQNEGSDILTVTGLLRTAIDGNKLFKHPDVGGDVEVVQAAKFMDAIVQSFTADTDLDEQRVLCWTNRRVDDINAAIRRNIYGKDAAPFEVGERIVTGGPVKSDDEILLSTDEECIVKAVQPSSVFDEDSGEDYKTILLTLSPIHADVRQVFTHVLDVSEHDRYWDRLNDLAKKAKSNPAMSRQFWARYHDFKDLFANIKYCYCLTIHRSQGSTYKRVFVDVKDVLRNNIRTERQRLLYVAFSRPSEQLIINRQSYAA